MYYIKEETPLLTKNAPLESETKNLGRALPPPNLDKIQKNNSFFSGRLPYLWIAYDPFFKAKA